MDELDLVSLGKQSIKGVLALISQTFILQAISTVSFLIVLTILTPAEVGIFVAVTALRRIIDFFTDFGFGAALVQKKAEVTLAEMRTSFTIQAGITAVIFIGAFLLRDYIAGMLKLDEQGKNLLLALIFTVFLSSFKTIPSILLERKIQFHKLIIPQIAEALTYNIVLVILVLNGFRVDSYSYAFLAAGLIGLPFYYFVSPWKIGIAIDRNALHNLKFGAQFQVKNILATIKDDLLTVILTSFLSFTQIGYIGFAQRIAYLPYRYIVDSVTKVTFASFSRIQENIEVLKKAIEKSLFFVSSIMFPVLIGILLTVPNFINFYPKWNNKWEPAIFSLIFFCLNAAVSSLSGILVNILDATGRVRKTLYLMVIWTILTWILTPLFIFYFGYNGVAVAALLVSATIVYTIYLVKKIVKIEFMKSIYKPIICSVVMGCTVFILNTLYVKDFISLFIVIAIGGSVYLASYYLVAKKELQEGINLIFKQNEK